MKASDKIYVNFPFGEEYPWRGPMVTDQGLNQHDTTYIRKDALLEWAKEQKAMLKQGYKKDWKNDDTLNGGRLMLDKLINKLGSM